MYAIYKITLEELNLGFLESLKKVFKNKKKALEIAVYETDETDYLLGSKTNRSRLLNAVKNVRKDRNIVTPDQKQFR